MVQSVQKLLLVFVLDHQPLCKSLEPFIWSCFVGGLDQQFSRPGPGLLFTVLVLAPEHGPVFVCGSSFLRTLPGLQRPVKDKNQFSVDSKQTLKTVWSGPKTRRVPVLMVGL